MQSIFLQICKLNQKEDSIVISSLLPSIAMRALLGKNIHATSWALGIFELLAPFLVGSGTVNIIGH